jgi:hypothetical protein
MNYELIVRSVCQISVQMSVQHCKKIADAYGCTKS